MLAAAPNTPLRSPSAGMVTHIAAFPVGVLCIRPPAAVRDVIGVSYYSDAAHHSVVDPVKFAQNQKNLQPIRDFLKTITDASDAAARGDGRAAVCAYRLFNAWATADAMNGTVNHQGEYEREWTLGGLALAYLKIRDTGLADPTAAENAAWFSRLARAVEPYYPTGGASNNHDYWAGVAVAASGIAANDRALYDWGIAKYKVGVDQITPDGTLPLEMARGARALHYHLFAIEPLVMIAEMGRANGQDLYSLDNGAINRLANRSVSGIEDPSYFTRASGVLQDIKPGGHLSIDEVAWMEPYVAHLQPFDTATAWIATRMRDILKPYRPVIYPRLGGNLTELYSPRGVECHGKLLPPRGALCG
jgi:poly(beta-D-mannuronate) lyase